MRRRRCCGACAFSWWTTRPRSAGTLPWQFNEPFPNAWCTSAAGYDGRPKLAYFAVADAYEPIQLSARYASQAAPEGLDVTLVHVAGGRVLAGEADADVTETRRILGM